jgi:uncharacterized protein involved in exopolysaccharide biosynthesis
VSGTLRAPDARVLASSIFIRRRWLIAGVLLAPLLAAGARTASSARFKAQAEVLVQDSDDANPFLKDMVVHWKVKNRLPVIQSVLRSHATIVRVLKTLEQVDDTTPPAQIDAAVRSFRRRLEVFGVGGGLVRISFTAGTPEAAHRGLSVAVDTFIEEMLRPQTRAIEDSTVFLSGQLSRLRKELTDLEGQMSKFKTENASELPEVYRLNLDSYLVTRKALMSAEARLEAALGQRKVVEERLRVFDPVVREVEASFIRKKAELSQLRSTFTDEHPDVLRARAEVGSLRAQLTEAQGRAGSVDLTSLESLASRRLGGEDTEAGDDGRADDLLTSELLSYKALLAEIEGIRGEIVLLKKRLGESQGAVKAFAANEQTLTRLVRETETKAAVYRSLLEKYEDALVTRELAIYDEEKQVWIVDPPSKPTAPIGASLLLVLIGAALGGLMLAAAAAVALDLALPRLRLADQVAETTGMEVLGVMPRTDT